MIRNVCDRLLFLFIIFLELQVGSSAEMNLKDLVNLGNSSVCVNTQVPGCHKFPIFKFPDVPLIPQTLLLTFSVGQLWPFPILKRIEVFYPAALRFPRRSHN